MSFRTATPAVELQNISKSFGHVQALNKVSLSVQPGEIVALLGPNGAGKTTAISIMLGLRKPTSGSATLFGADPTVPSSHRRVACMLQEAKVPDTLKVREVVEMFRRLYDSDVSPATALAAADLMSKANTRVGKLSGGERQRLYFALCVVADPDLLFLDEPTVAMDVESRRRFWEQIEHMVDRGKTIVLTTHYLEEADALAERVIVINHGQVIAQGSPSDIKSRVSGKSVRFRSQNMEDTLLASLPGISQLTRKNTLISFRTFQPETVIKHLFNQGVTIEDLEITSVGLEEAFVSLTHNPQPKEMLV